MLVVHKTIKGFFCVFNMIQTAVLLLFANVLQCNSCFLWVPTLRFPGRHTIVSNFQT